MSYKIEVEGTKFTPNVSYDSDSGVLEIQGNSINNVDDLYSLVSGLIKKQKSKCCEELKVTMNLNVITARTQLAIYQILKDMDSDNLYKKKSVDWCYYFDDPIVKEIGEDLADMVKTPVNFISVGQN